MDKDNTVNEPVAPAPNAAESQVATTETVAAAPDQTQTDTAERLYAGKYKSVEEMEHGYKELESKLGRQAPASVPAPQQVPAPGYAPANSISNAPVLDPEADLAVRAVIREEHEAARVADFTAKHASELADPVLFGTVSALMQQARESRTYLNQETALEQAKALIADKAKPLVVQASSESFAEGQDLARMKEKAGAIGDTTKTAPPIDPNSLSAEEYAKVMNIPRYNG